MSHYIKQLSPRMNELFTLVQKKVRDGITRDQFRKALRKNNLGGFRDEDLTKAENYIRGGIEKGKNANRVSRNRYLSLEGFVEGSVRQKRKFNWVVEVRGTHPQTGLEVSEALSISTDKRLTMGEVSDEAIRISKAADIIDKPYPTHDPKYRVRNLGQTVRG